MVLYANFLASYKPLHSIRSAHSLVLNARLYHQSSCIFLSFRCKVLQARRGPNGSCLFAAGSPNESVDSHKLPKIIYAFLVTERPMPALLLRLLHRCADDIEMNQELETTPTPSNSLRLMQWRANGISGKNTELLTFFHSNNVNIADIQETMLINKIRPMKVPGWAVARHDHHKNKVSGLLMLSKNTIPFVDNTAVLSQSVDPHQKQHGISITMLKRQQIHIHNIHIPPRNSFSAGHNASIAHLLSID